MKEEGVLEAEFGATIKQGGGKEMITYGQRTGIDQFSTVELVEELKLRQGVQSASIPPYESYTITTGNNLVQDTGPVVIFVVKD
ncbi:MAG TPA: BC1881 family protein [Bacilli bacterium]|nr:BC1881 family protein [Bacilli bacterium]